MGKLGKKARKFAKKNLQSVLKRKRKLKVVFKRKSGKRDKHGELDDTEEKKIKQTNKSPEFEDIKEVPLDAIFGDDDNDMVTDDSDSDAYLSEDSDLKDMTEGGNEDYLEENDSSSSSSMQNKEIQLQVSKEKRKLERLKEKDPEFSRFLENYDKGLGPFRNDDDYSDEDETSNDGKQLMNEDGSNSTNHKVLTSSTFNSLCQLLMEQQSVPALIRLLNGYRAACHYGNESSGILDYGLRYRIQDTKTFCNILMFTLHKVDSIFRGMLGVSCSSCKKETILELKNNSKWKTLKPLVKSYLRSTLLLLVQITDSDILAFTLSRLRASIILFAPFSHLLQRLIKIAVHLWSTGEGNLSSHAFIIIKDVSTVFSTDCFDTCLIETYKAFIGHCKFAEPTLSKHVQFLRISLVELCSQDVLKTYSKAVVSIQQLAKILQLALRMKKKEAVKIIHSSEYTNCLDLWVTFLSVNIRDYDLQPLLYMIIQIINGVTCLFPGPRYLPFRIKCIQWLNHLSSSSDTFIPVASYVLDMLEYKVGKEGGKPGKDLEVSSAVKLPKHWLKSQNFQDHCVFSVIELLAVHFAQWSYHISFPELATIPLIQLRKFHEITASESLRRAVKRFIDQVEQNIDFVQQKRDEAAFSPKDQQSVDSFLQHEKCNSNAKFTQYYKSVIEKAASRNLSVNEKMSPINQKKSNGKKQQCPNGNANGGVPKKRKNEGHKNSKKKSKI